MRSIWAKPEVAHMKHRGMGGNPTADRSLPELMILVCNWRHKVARFSLDQKTIRCLPLTERGMRGPVQWQGLVECIVPSIIKTTEWLTSSAEATQDANSDWWMVLARETVPHEFQPFTEAQMTVLGFIRGNGLLTD
jgi:hypothetical protein